MNLQAIGFVEAGLPSGLLDRDVWQFCQDMRYHLITDNRNSNSPDSLEATLRSKLSENSLPVFTISDMSRLRGDRFYFDAVVAKLLDYLLDGDLILGSGRLFLP